MLGEPKITLTCDFPGCGAEEEIGLTTTARGYDERNVKREIESLGWKEVGENTHHCPEHEEEND